MLVPALLLVAGVAVYVLTLPPSRSPEGPQVSPTVLSVASPGPAYGVGKVWNNFTVTAYRTNLTWNLFQFFITPGPLTRGPANWTLFAQTTESALLATFVYFAGDWTSSSSAPVMTGDTLVLETDSSLTMAEFGVSWPSLGTGTYGVELS